MSKLKHVNLFHHCEDKNEVYAAFQRDLDRDTYYGGISFWLGAR